MKIIVMTWMMEITTMEKDDKIDNTTHYIRPLSTLFE